MSKRVYHPTETHLSLHPPREIKTCINPDCRTRFAARPLIDSEDENPDLCLSCNRAKWSRLWNRNRPVNTPEADFNQFTEFDLTSESDVGEVISYLRRVG